MGSPLRSAALHARAVKRLVPASGGSLRERLGPLEERLVFVLGCPRSGTTFLGQSIGSLPGFVDLGEVPPLKAAIPELSALPRHEAARTIRRILAATRRLGLVGSRRTVEHTPETAFVAEALVLAFPQAKLVHIVRDGRDVVCSLLERGWLSAGRRGEDDAGLPFGAAPRFWVEQARAEEFAAATDAKRAAWAWRRYVSAARSVGSQALEIRYEEVATAPRSVARELAAFLAVCEEPLAHALSRSHAESVGRYRRELTAEQLADVMDESGELLSELGYVST